MDWQSSREVPARLAREPLPNMSESVLADPQSDKRRRLADLLGIVLGLPGAEAALGKAALAGTMIGPRGMARLAKAGLADSVTPFNSRWFRQRGEINPSDMAQVAFRLGGPIADIENAFKAASVGKYGQALPTPSEVQLPLSRLIGKELYPELYAAYPKLADLPVNVTRSARERAIRGSYEQPVSNSMPVESFPKYNRVERKLQERFARRNPDPPLNTPNYNQQYNDWLQQRRGYVESKIPSWRDYIQGGRPEGSINLNLPDQMTGDYPGRQLAETLLHEVQHYVQGQELSGGRLARLVSVYKNADDILFEKYRQAFAEKQPAWGEGNILGKWDPENIRRQPEISFTNPIKKSHAERAVEAVLNKASYRANPFEREARDAAMRDTVPKRVRDLLRRVGEKQ